MIAIPDKTIASAIERRRILQIMKETTIDYFLRIAYDGTDYGGWQRQANHAHTIQQTVEESLATVLGHKVAVTGCGRTDAGVHASQFYLYMGVPMQVPSEFVFYMSKNLPGDIELKECLGVHEDAHACLDATSRTYDYFFHDCSDVWLTRVSGRLGLNRFDPTRVAEALPYLLEFKDYRAFCLTPNRHNSTLVRFSEVTLFQSHDRSRFRIRFVANRFLRGMIRILVNELWKVGCGESTLSEFESLLNCGNRPFPVRLAPPEGLFLTGVKYPYLERLAELPLSGQIAWEIVPSLPSESSVER